MLEMVGRAVTRYHFRGIKIHGFDALPTREICDAARRFGVPILVDVVGQPQVVEMFAPEYPDVDFIIPHLGSFADDWKAQQQVCDQLVRHPNVYGDTSGVRRFDYIVQAVKRAASRSTYAGRQYSASAASKASLERSRGARHRPSRVPSQATAADGLPHGTQLEYVL